jgi:hypothetical protein
MIAWERRNALPICDPNVFPAVREMYYRDRIVLGADPWYLFQEFYEEGYLPYLPTLSNVGAAQDALIEAERVLSIPGAATLYRRRFFEAYPRLKRWHERVRPAVFESPRCGHPPRGLG